MKRQNGRTKAINKKRRANLGAVAFVVLLLCCVIAYKKIDLDIQETTYAKKMEELEKTKKKEKSRSKEIKDYKVYVQSKQYVEQEARDKLGLTYPDEIIFEAEDD
ncbi:MAG: septum formation initiator family protein [Acetivibrio sp.]